jgi:hypothetical protein
MPSLGLPVPRIDVVEGQRIGGHVVIFELIDRRITTRDVASVPLRCAIIVRKAVARIIDE